MVVEDDREMNFLQDREHHFHALVMSTRDLDNYVYRFQSTADPSVVIRVLRGKRMHSEDQLFDEFAAAFQFPLYFGRNWDALEECIRDLDWLPAQAYVLVISDAAFLLNMQPPRSVGIFLGYSMTSPKSGAMGNCRMSMWSNHQYLSTSSYTPTPQLSITSGVHSSRS